MHNMRTTSFADKHLFSLIFHQRIDKTGNEVTPTTGPKYYKDIF